jgi:hypothetical protein
MSAAVTTVMAAGASSRVCSCNVAVTTSRFSSSQLLDVW